MDNEKINTEATQYLESKKKKLRVLVKDWENLANEAPQKFMQLIKGGMKPKIERGNSTGRQLNVSLSFEMNTDAAKKYLETVKEEIERIGDTFKAEINDINKKLQYFYDAGVGAKEFTSLVRLFSDYVDCLGNCTMEMNKNTISLEVPSEFNGYVKKWKDIDNVQMRQKEAERLGIDVKDLDKHKKYLEAKRKKATAKTSAAMTQIAKQFASISTYLDAATLQAEAENEAKVLKEKEDEAERIRLEEEERRRKEEEARKAEEERQRKEAAYVALVAEFNKAQSIEEYQDLKKQFNSIADYKDCKDYAQKCAQTIHEMKYNAALNAFNEAKTVEDFKHAVDLFEKVKNYKDANNYIEKCHEKAREVECEGIYQEGLFAMEQGAKASYKDAIVLFKEIPDYKDVAQKIEECENKISILQAQEDEANQRAKEAEEEEKRKKEEEKKAKEKKKKKIMSMISIVSIVILVITIAVPYYQNVLQPKMKYNNAVELLENKQYDEAEAIFIELGSYSDSANMVYESRYQKAMNFYNEKEYEKAAKIFDELDSYSESSSYHTKSLFELGTIYFNQGQYQEAVDALYDVKYTSTAKSLYQESLYQLGLKQFKDGLYQEGYETLFDSNLRSYKDSREQAKELYYQQGLVFYDAKEFDKSNEIFKKLGSYKDSKSLIHNHSYTEQVISVLTCEQNGEVVRTCSSCGTMENIVTEAKGHQYTEATCTSPSVCSACGLEKAPALGHKLENQVCTTCGDIVIEPLVFEESHSALEEDVYTIVVPKGTYRFNITTKLNSNVSRWSIKINGSEIYFGSNVTKKSGSFAANKTILNDNTDSELIVRVNGSYKLEITPVND